MDSELPASNARSEALASSEADLIGLAASVPSKYSNLTPEQYLTLSEMQESQLIQTILRLIDKEQLDPILDDIAAPIKKKIRRVLDGQYATSVDVTSDTDLENDPELDSVIDAYISNQRDGSNTNSKDDMIRIACGTPLRVSYEEREFLRLVSSILDVSDYIDRNDSIRLSKERRSHHCIRSICSILHGLVIAYRYDLGQKLMVEKNYDRYAGFFQEIFEITRRYKIANPEKLRNEYVKLMYFLMDLRAYSDEVEFDCIIPIKTVYSVLSKKHNGLALLKDPLLRLATAEIMPDGKSRKQIQWEIEQKQRAIKTLVQRYAGKQSVPILSRLTSSIFPRTQYDDTPSSVSTNSKESEKLEEMTKSEIELCIYSLGDRNTFLRFNCDPCSRMIAHLQKNFHPTEIEDNLSLSIKAGENDSRLSHSHERQYCYVLQSLHLWKEVLQEMYGLWNLAETDLLSLENPYVLKDSGQGLQRVQQAPHVYRSMCRILKKTHAKVGCWYGSSEIHLGDHNVPNALLFIDKYLQVPRILQPILLCLEKIPELAVSSKATQEYITNAFGSENMLKKIILADFFRHAFDGSGADNFYDAGSCVDGRLTSAWNWCSKIETKSFFPVFSMTGFVCFDGRF